MQLLVVNVGINSSDAAKRKLKSPVFPDGTFEFIPIKEPKGASEFCKVKYKDLKCHNNPLIPLREYFEMPKISEYYAHNDPDFKNFTYGDIDTSRSSNLKNAHSGDKILFLARLYDHDGTKFCSSSGLYFVGLITVSKNLYLDLRNNLIPDHDEFELRDNVHFIKYKNGNEENFRIIVGDKSSSYRFHKALKVSPDVAALIFNGRYDSVSDCFISNASSKKVANKNGRTTKYSNFHSNTRSIQVYLNSGRHTTKKLSLEKLLSIIQEQCL